ncbi:MAG: sporulation initiation factor Spo0A C-terminal domain-containing protein [Clostridia bacterium]|nr:sporulation initiation factor Spo0A C-terminal domain-containing protein [Clostridia bacterium]
MKHVHILITDDASPEQTVLQLPDALLPIVHLTAERSADDAVTGQIRSILLSAGMPPHLKGYHYLIAGIELVTDDPQRLERLTSDLYPAIAERFGTTASKVERAIRHAIDITWQRGRVEQVNQLVGCHAACQEDKPTNGQLIATVAELIWQQNKK